MEYRDWGERSSRWAGIRSETVEVCGSSVHFLTADAARPGAPAHLLIHSTAGSATNWLDTIRPLTAHGRVGPHTLRHAFITAALDAGVSLRDVQEAASHADPRTTMRYDRARASLDRHATYIIAAYIAGAAR